MYFTGLLVKVKEKKSKDSNDVTYKVTVKNEEDYNAVLEALKRKEDE